MRYPLLIAALAFCSSAMAQQSPAALTSADYARAEKFMGYNTTPLVLGVAGRPNWMPDGRLWYRVTRESGPEFLIADQEDHDLPHLKALKDAAAAKNK
jgi:hypothetical protein